MEKKTWKTMMAFVCALCMLTGLAACKKEEVPVEKEGSAAASEELQEAEETEAAEEPETEKTEETEGMLPAGMENMLAPMDSLMMCMYENGYAYGDDPYVFWVELRYLLGNYYGMAGTGVSTEDAYLRVEPEVVKEFASSLTADFQELPEMPGGLENMVLYDAEKDTYLFAAGDRGLSQAEVLSCEKQENGSYQVQARLYGVEDGETICIADYTLISNHYQPGNGMEKLFSYSVSSMNMEPVEGMVEEVILEGEFQGLADSHTVEILLTDGVEAFQFLDEDVAAILSILEKDELIKFTASYDAQGAGTITGIIVEN